MTDRPESFGRRVARATSPAALLTLEAHEGRGDQFAMIDALVADLLRRSLQRERILALERGREQTSIALVGLDVGQRQIIAAHFTLTQQQVRGAWFLPEAATLEVGWANLPFYFAAHPRFATGIAAEERGKVALQGSPNALFTWAVLEPLFERLYRPLALRGALLGKKDRTWQTTAWQDVDAFFAALGFEVAAALAPMRYGGGWSKFDAQEQVRHKQAVLAALAEQASPAHAARYRAYQVQRLVGRYYQQAKREPPKLRQVLTRDLQRVVAGYFDVDWLAFLAYAGEEPHPDERIATALPEPRLMVADRDRITAVAAAQNLPVDEVARALAAFWGTGQETSPVEERVHVLRDVWRAFDAIHARQAPGMPPLWGLVDDGIGLTAGSPYQPGLYRMLLPADLLSRIEQFWGTCMLPRWPDRVVSTVAPHVAMAEAFGPALRFWHGCALTAWFVCEGPMSRTDLPGLADHYRAELAELDGLGCPVDASLFAELTRAEGRLGPPEPIPMKRERQEVAPGITVAIKVSAGSRRAGFELLRDIISRHRRVWATCCLESYLRARWETDIRDAARDFGLLHERKGKPPSVRQFATHAAPATNHWFGGDITGLYRMIGEKAPVVPVRSTIMPPDREAFARAVLDHLTRLAETSDGAGTTSSVREDQRELAWLAEQSLDLVQRAEALGRPATLNEFGRERFAYRAASLAPEVDVAWTHYQEAIEAAKQSPMHLLRHQPGEQLSPPPRAVEANMANTENVPQDASTLPLKPRKEKRPWWKRLFDRE